MAKQAHVPKFGNWEGDGVPYTAYFENARRGKASGRRMNPNDPEDNPEVFEALAGTLESCNKPVEASSISDHKQKVRNHKSERSVGDRSSFDRPGGKKGSNDHSYSSFSSSTSSGHPPKPKYNDQNPPSGNQAHHRAASIPKFGSWDETDPTSGEGFTVIFNKVKQEKHVAAVRLPTPPQPPNKHSSKKNKTKCGRSRLASKIGCCFLH